MWLIWTPCAPLNTFDALELPSKLRWVVPLQSCVTISNPSWNKSESPWKIKSLSGARGEESNAEIKIAFGVSWKFAIVEKHW